MFNIGAYAVIAIIGFIVVFGLIKKVDVFDVFMSGAKTGLNTSVSILPALIGLVFSVNMLKSSGALDLLYNFISPLMVKLNIPAELLPLMLLRPVSGSGALAVCNDLFTSFGADSTIGRIASVMMGSTETTFYAVAIYYGSVGIKKTRHTIPSAISADITGFILSVVTVTLFF